MSYLTAARCALLLFSVALSCNGYAAAAQSSAQIPRIADERSVAIKLDAEHFRGAREFSIKTPDAAFIKIHFDYFNLPEGVVLEVASPDGREVYRYGNTQRDGYTVDKNLGQDGVRSFSAMSIDGPVAQLRLVGSGAQAWTAAHGIKVSRYLEGYPQGLLPELQDLGLLTGTKDAQSICGIDDKRSVACFQSSDPVAFDRSRPVAKIITPLGACTAWRVGADNRMLTNNHCFNSAADVAASEIWFNFQNTTCTGTTVGTVTKVPGDVMLRNDVILDYALFRVKNFSTIAAFGYFGLDVRLPTLGEEIFIPQHAGGRVKQLAVTSDQNSGGRCKIDIPVQNGNGNNTDTGYLCDTEPGSSGSPVVARFSRNVIALNHASGCPNFGVHIVKIWPQISSYFGGVIPGGDAGGGGNAAPVANFSFWVSGRTVYFTDSSSDIDGSIFGRSWNFGDGTTSSAINPVKTYAVGGNYTVILTVTDNRLASNSKSKPLALASTPLQNGIAKSGLAANGGAELRFTLAVPAGATNLKFVTSGGSGDADLYVKFGSPPSTTLFDCRPFAPGNAETCNIAVAQAGTYHVMVRAFSAISGVTLTGSYTPGP